MKLLVLGGWDLETWALIASVHVYDFLFGMAGAFSFRERGGGACGRCGARFQDGHRERGRADEGQGVRSRLSCGGREMDDEWMRIGGCSRSWSHIFEGCDGG